MNSRFTLSENPQHSGCRSEGGAGMFIIHHLNPVAIIEADLDGPVAEKLSKQFTYINSDDVREVWTLTIRFCFQNIGGEDVNTDKLLTRGWHWFAAYLKWEDSNIDTDEEANYN